jgi:hypothetical protein
VCHIFFFLTKIKKKHKTYITNAAHILENKLDLNCKFKLHWNINLNYSLLLLPGSEHSSEVRQMSSHSVEFSSMSSVEFGLWSSSLRNLFLALLSLCETVMPSSQPKRPLPPPHPHGRGGTLRHAALVGLSDVELELRALVTRLVLPCLQVRWRHEELGLLP